MHVGRPKAQKKEKNGKGKKPNNQTTQREIIMYLENENKELKDKITEIEMDQTTGTTDRNNNQSKMNELEAEIECLLGQIHENDSYVEQLEQTHIQVTDLTLKLNQAQATENQLQTEIDNLKISIEELQEMNAKLKSENRSLKEKNKEANKHAKKMELSAQKLAGEKTTLEQVAQEKSERIVELETKITQLENQNETSMEEEQAPAKPTVILGDSNCRDVQAHLMMWLNRDIRHEWAPTLQAAKEWVQNNKEDLDGTTIILLAGTNNIKNYDPHHVVSQMHREVTQAITDAGATLIITQLPPVYSPQPRAESRNKSTDIINAILLERHGMAVASTEAINIHRGQMKKDGLHITNESAEILAEKISETVKRLESGPTSKENLKITFTMDEQEAHAKDDDIMTDVITTSRHTAAKIIGKGGERIRRIKTLYNVAINTRDEDLDKRTFTIKGSDKDVTKVVQLLNKMASETEERDNEQREMAAYTNAPTIKPRKFQANCRFFAKGKCDRGNQCKFIHGAGPVDISDQSDSSEDMEQPAEPSPKRTVTIKRKEEPAAKKSRRQHTPPRGRQQPTTSRSKRERTSSPSSSRSPPRERPAEDDDSPRRARTSRDESRHRSRSSHRRPRTPEKNRRDTRSRSPTPMRRSRDDRRSRPASRTRPGRKTRTPSPARTRTTKRDDRRSRPSSRSRPERETRSPSPSRPSRDSSRYPRRSPSPRRPSRREPRRTPSPRWSDYHRRSRSHSPRPSTRTHHRYGWTREGRELEEAISAILSRTGRH